MQSHPAGYDAPAKPVFGFPPMPTTSPGVDVAGLQPRGLLAGRGYTPTALSLTVAGQARDRGSNRRGTLRKQALC